VLRRISILTLLVLCLALAIRWRAALTWMGSFLVDSKQPRKADLVLVMGGDFWGPRVITAAELGKHGYAPIVLLSGPPYQGKPEGQFGESFLVTQGYPRDLFQVFGHHARSTIGEAVALRDELARRRVTNVLLVTSNYHSRRAAIVMTLFCPGVNFISVPAPDANYHSAEWWKDPSSKRLCLSEWSKILATVFAVYPVYAVARIFGRGKAVIPAYLAAEARMSTLRIFAIQTALEIGS
jgi:uncharacterized SAM-binding protein YcdF (DUF218 family)